MTRGLPEPLEYISVVPDDVFQNVSIYFGLPTKSDGVSKTFKLVLPIEAFTVIRTDSFYNRIATLKGQALLEALAEAAATMTGPGSFV